LLPHFLVARLQPQDYAGDKVETCPRGLAGSASCDTSSLEPRRVGRIGRYPVAGYPATENRGDDAQQILPLSRNEFIDINED
jgi:hypothetical protein